MLRRFACRTSAIALTATSSRGMWTTQQSSQLAGVKAERGYTSDLWVSESDDGWWFTKETALKADKAAPTRAVLPKRLELINASQLKTPLDMPEPEEHSSVSSSKAYKGATLRELQQRVMLHDYTSKWWLTPNIARQRNLQLLPRNRPHAILMRVPVEVYNIEELADPTKASLQAISGESGRPVFGEMGSPLKMAAIERGYATGIYFTESSLGDFVSVGVALKKDAAAVETTSTEVNTFYNLEDFENEAAIRAVAPGDYSPDPSKPRYLTTGSAFGAAHIVTALEASGYAESLWMSHKDLQFKQQRDADTFRLKPGVAGIEVPAFNSMWYNVDEMADREAALRAVGTMTR